MDLLKILKNIPDITALCLFEFKHEVICHPDEGKGILQAICRTAAQQEKFRPSPVSEIHHDGNSEGMTASA